MSNYGRRRSWCTPGPPDVPGQAEERAKAIAAGKQANLEMMEKFAPLTPENAQEAVTWQANRIKELMA